MFWSHGIQQTLTGRLINLINTAVGVSILRYNTAYMRAKRAWVTNITVSYSLQAERSGVPTPVDREASVFQNQSILVLGPNLHLKRVPWLFPIGKAAAAWR